MNKHVFYLIVFLISFSVAQGQSADFSGTWLLLKRISISGNDYGNGVPRKIVINQNKDTIFIQRHISTQKGIDTIYTETAILSREVMSTIPQERLRRITVQSVNRFEFNENMTYEAMSSGKVIRKIVYSWKLSGENRLTLRRQDDDVVTGDKWIMEGIYMRRTF